MGGVLEKRAVTKSKRECPPPPPCPIDDKVLRRLPSSFSVCYSQSALSTSDFVSCRSDTRGISARSSSTRLSQVESAELRGCVVQAASRRSDRRPRLVRGP